MILFLEIAGGVVLVVLGSLLIPRIHLECMYNSTTAYLNAGNPFYHLRFDFNTFEITLAVWGIKIRRTVAQISEMLARPEPTGPAPTPPDTITKPETESPPPAPQRQTVVVNRVILKMIWTERGVLWRLTKIILVGLKDLFFAIRIDNLYANITLATPDPSYTGILYGALQPFTLFNKPPNRIICFTPDFMGGKISLDAFLKISIRPLRLLPTLVGILRALPYRDLKRIYSEMRRTA